MQKNLLLIMELSNHSKNEYHARGTHQQMKKKSFKRGLERKQDWHSYNTQSVWWRERALARLVRAKDRELLLGRPG